MGPEPALVYPVPEEVYYIKLTEERELKLYLPITSSFIRYLPWISQRVISSVPRICAPARLFEHNTWRISAVPHTCTQHALSTHPSLKPLTPKQVSVMELKTTFSFYFHDRSCWYEPGIPAFFSTHSSSQHWTATTLSLLSSYK